MRKPMSVRFARRLSAAIALFAVAGAAPAFADHHHDRHWHHPGHRHWGYDGGYYAPPPVVYSRPYYAPPPVVYAPGFGVNIHIP